MSRGVRPNNLPKGRERGKVNVRTRFVSFLKNIRKGHVLCLEPNPQQVQNLRQIKHGQEPTQREEREPKVGLFDVGSVDRRG